MKKIISSVLALSMLISGISAFAFSDIDASDKTLAHSVQTLQLLNVLHGYADGSFKPDNTVTRAEMAKIALSLVSKKMPAVAFSDEGHLMMQVENIGAYDGGGSKYTDMEQTHWAYPMALRMRNMKCMMGYEDGTFRPENPVTYAEALKVIVEMLGYGDMAKLHGGYPDGYMRVAQQLKITENMNFDLSAGATRGDIAIIVANSLDIPHMMVTTYAINGGATEYAVSDVTFRRMISE